MIIVDKINAVIDWTQTYFATIAYQACALMFAPDLSEWEDLSGDEAREPDRRMEPVDIIDRIDALVNESLAQGKRDRR